MKRNFISLLCFLFFLINNCFSQVPVVNWQNTIGGIASDYLKDISSTSDNGCLLTGYSNSNISGDKSDNTYGGNDFWVVKTNASGIIEWQNTIGGSASDEAYAAEQTADGGYIIGGLSSSGISGEKTVANKGGTDYWIIKLNSVGDILWQKTIGGSSNDELRSIHELPDGGFIVGGISVSGISGDKTEAGKGSNDYWVLKLDNGGNIIWQNTIGTFHNDWFVEIMQATDGGFILGGYTTAGISGDKTEYSSGSAYWVLKLNVLGDIIWQNTIYALTDSYLYGLDVTMDGGVVLAGGSSGPAGIDKSENSIGIMFESSTDYWIVKLNSSGSVEWDNTIGGAETDICYSIIENPNGYIVAGTSTSNVFGDKHNRCFGSTDIWVVYLDLGGNVYAQKTLGGMYNVHSPCIVSSMDGGIFTGGPSSSSASGIKTENSIGQEDYWILKIDSAMIEYDYNIDWQDTIGGLGDEVITTIVQEIDGSYLTGGRSNSGIGGDKSEICYGDYDYWIVKYSGDGNVLWQKTIGGSGTDYLEIVKQTPDGGFILGGYSNSPLSGNKTENSINNDYWIVKVDHLGNIQWQNTIGGIDNDRLRDLIVQTDGSYVVTGTSLSGIGGDKTEACFGAEDYWILKLDPTGNILWQKTIGGSAQDYSNRILLLPDGSLFAAGYSISNVSGNKTAINKGNHDYWIVKLTEDGNIIWDKSYGSSLTDYFTSLIIADDEILLSGYSEGGITFDKSEINAGAYDLWFVKTDFDGNILWDNTFGGPGYDYLHGYNLQYDLDKGFSAVSFTDSGQGGDKWTIKQGCTDIWVLKFDSLGNNLWQEPFGDNGCEAVYGGVFTSADQGLIFGITTENNFWIIKLNGSCSPSTELCNSLDDNCNGLIDDAITETISISAAGPITFCQGGNVLLSATYSGATLQWKKNGTNIPGATSSTYLVNSKGTYTCETTSPCDTELSTGIFVNVQKNPPASITAGGATTFCAGGSVILTANAGGGLSYQWYKGASLIAGATSINYTATIAGNYKCRVTKTATGCFKNSNVIGVSVPCKEGELLNDENAFSIYPNPNDGTFTIEANVKTQDFASSESTIEIYNNLGQLIYSQKTLPSDGRINERIELKNISSGLYLVKINNNFQLMKNLIID